jgi:uncharacterized caspase-like protein
MVLSQSELIDAVLEPRHDRRAKRRLALVLDCCHSGRTLAEVVVDKRQKTDFLLIDGFAACMHDELSWELDLLGHGVLTSSMGAKPAVDWKEGEGSWRGPPAKATRRTSAGRCTDTPRTP